MSLCAIIPVANLVAANASLEAQGFGPGNFSVAAYAAPKATHAALHTWYAAAFYAAVKAVAGVAYDDKVGEPVPDGVGGYTSPAAYPAGWELQP